MESFLNRYRSITILLLVVFAQLVLLAMQVRNDQDVRMIRVWTVTAVTPVARLIEGFRGGGAGFLRRYILLHNADAENRRLQAELDRLKVENIFLKNELNTADRAQALQVLQSHIPSKTLAATMFMAGAGSSSKVVFVDRGSISGVQRGMAVVTPDGIVGKVMAAYPMASEVVLITDPDFAAGVISQKNQARGTLKGQGTPLCKVDYVPYGEKVEAGEWFYTSGDDRIFPRGFPAGVVKSVRNAQPYKEIYLEPSGLQRGLEDVLILVEGVHMEIPDAPPTNQQVYIGPPAPPAAGPGGAPGAVQPPPAAGPGTAADSLRSQYKAAGDAQGHTFGVGDLGSKPPDFTKLGQAPAVGAGGRGPEAGAGGGREAGAGGRGPGSGASAAKPAAGIEQRPKPGGGAGGQPGR
jgi:rod shape-determining protein MreC